MTIKNLLLVLVALAALTTAVWMFARSGPFNDGYREPNSEIQGTWKREDAGGASWAPTWVGKRIAVVHGITSIEAGSAAVKSDIVLCMAGDHKLTGTVTVSEPGYLVANVQVPDPDNVVNLCTVEIVMTQLGKGGKVSASDGVSNVLLTE